MNWLAGTIATGYLLLSATLAGAQPTAGYRELVIHAWSIGASSPEGRALLGELASGGRGTQSRDLGDQILELAGLGKIGRHPECVEFSVEFFDANFEDGRGTHVLVNGGIVTLTTANFGPGNRLQVTGCGGGPSLIDGILAVPVAVRWNSKVISLEIHSPFQLSALRYPRSGSLKTCGRATARRCGGMYNPDEPSSLSRRISEPGVTHFHFVVK